jgi:ribosomal-protein-alanine N-acetyltransferase
MKVPELVSERLILRPHEESDADFMIELNADPAVTRFTGDGPIDRASALQLIRDLERQFAERRLGRFLVLRRDTNHRIGFCGLKATADPRVADLGFRFLRRCWGYGYATEAAAASVSYGFEDRGLGRITAEVEAGNQRSIRVLEKLGFRCVGTNAAGDTLWDLERPEKRE